MGKGRLEAFSDGVIAIIITIMVLEMKALLGDHLEDLRPIWPAFLSDVLSFIFVGICWNNHLHDFPAVERASGATLWADLHLLFWLSLIPFVTSWVGRNDFATWPVVSYGVALLMCAIAWEIERRALLAIHDPTCALATAMGHSFKEWISALLYVVAIAGAFVNTAIAGVLYFVVAAIWIVPDRRIERAMATNASRPDSSAGLTDGR